MTGIDTILISAGDDDEEIPEPIDPLKFGNWLQYQVNTGINVVLCQPAVSTVPAGRFRRALVPLESNKRKAPTEASDWKSLMKEHPVLTDIEKYLMSYGAKHEEFKCSNE